MAYIGNQPTLGQYRKLDDISGSFNGSLTAFTMQVSSTNVSAGSAFQLLISLGGVIQNPGTDFTVSGSTITFTTAPAAALSFFGILMGQPLNAPTPGDGTITAAKIADGTITGAKLAAAFNYDSGLLFLDDTNNRVGIGTTSTNNLLTVNSNTANTAITIQSSNSGDAAIVFGDQDDFSRGRIKYENSTDALAFETNNLSEAARIDSSGRLLVGTTSPVSTFYTSGIFQVASTSGGTCVFGRQDATVVDGNAIGSLSWWSDQGGGYEESAKIAAVADGTHADGDKPTRLGFYTTAASASSPTERMRLANDGRFYLSSTWYSTFTTANAANVHSVSNGEFYRSTSSLKYKTDVETIQDSYSDAILNIRPVWYRSLADADNSDHSWWGFIAEEVAEVDPRLVQWKTVDVSFDEKGSPVETPCDPEPEGVAYDRFVPHLLNLIKRQQQAIETLEAKVAALEAN